MADSASSDFYRLLQISPDADPEVVKAAFRVIMNRLGAHPDKGGDPKRARRLIEAYRTLTDPEARLRYDTHKAPRHPPKLLTGAANDQAGETPALARIQVGQDIVIGTRDHRVRHAVLIDISGSGARIEVRLPLRIGDELDVSTKRDPLPFALAEVARVIRPRREFGVRWLELWEDNIEKGMLWDARC